MEENESPERERERKAERAVREFQKRNFEDKYVGATISKLKVCERGASIISAYIKKPKHLFVYLGNAGVGKTYFCSALADWAIRNFESVRMHKEEDVLSRSRNIIASGMGDYLSDALRTVDDDLIMLDDVGSWINADKYGDMYDPPTATKMEYRRELMFAIVDYRYSSNKPTIFTSNLNRDSFFKTYGDRMHSRLFAKENTIFENFNAPDLRQLGY